MKLLKLTFNPFEVNTYILADREGRCWVIDPGMYTDAEKKAFDDLIQGNDLKVQAFINTHAHVDHVLGNEYVRNTYGAPLWAHSDCIPFLKHGPEHAIAFGLDMEKPGNPDRFIEEGDTLTIDNNTVEILSTPGHADGSICLHIPSMKMLFAGDVLFNGSIGRTDLPTGNMDTLLGSIREKLMVLDPDTRVFPGHGPDTTIGFEKQSNPYLQ